MATSDVGIGQHYRDVQANVFGRSPPDLVVSRIFIGTDGKEYAELRSAANPNDKRSLSTEILRDKRRFVAVPQ